jgi:hypothetical protein
MSACVSSHIHAPAAEQGLHWAGGCLETKTSEDEMEKRKIDDHANYAHIFLILE